MRNTNLIFLNVLAVLFLSVIVFSCSDKPQNSERWDALLDKDLSRWNMYLSYELKNGYNGNVPVDVNGDTIQPIGYDNNYKNVFTVIEDNNEPILRISGEVYGCVFTKENYRNYHLRLKMKWGDTKWEPRLDKAFDSGILYHSQGVSGVDYWRSWMLSHEFQLMEISEEGSSGDYWCIGQTRMDVRARKDSANMVFDNNASVVSIGSGMPDGYYCAADGAIDKPKDEWNEIELICYEGKSLHIVNGKVVMALSNLRYVDNGIEKPLDEGGIQLQSEAGEVFYKDIEIKKIKEMPSVYKQYFE